METILDENPAESQDIGQPAKPAPAEPAPAEPAPAPTKSAPAKSVTKPNSKPATRAPNRPTPTLIPTSPPSPQPSDEDIFQKVFKKKKQVEWEVVALNVYYDQLPRPVGMINALVDGSSEGAKLEINETVKLLQLYVTSSNLFLEQIQSSAATDPKFENLQWVPIDTFKNFPYKISYNSSKLEIHLSVPPEIRVLQTASLAQIESDENNIPTLPPNLFSGFVNFNANQDFETDQSSFGTKNGRQPIRVYMDSGMNVASWVLESSGTYTARENQSRLPSFWRDNVRVVKDYKDYGLRQNIGDIGYPVRSFQVYKPMFGLSLYSQLALKPSRLTSPSANQELILKRPSRVKIFINNQSRQTLDLEAGRHNLQDFPLSYGLNDLRLEITNDLGETEIKELSFFSTSDNLKEELHQFNISIGAPTSIDRNLQYNYDFSNPTAFAFHRFGYSKNITLGSNIIRSPSAMLLGIEGSYTTPIGAFLLESAFSTVSQAESGFATNFKYHYTDYLGKDRTQRNFRFSLQVMSSGFSRTLDSYSPNLSVIELTTGYSQSISRKTNLNLNYNYSIIRQLTPSSENPYSIGVGLNRLVSRSLSLSTMLTQSKKISGVTDSSISFFVRMSLSDDGQYLSAGYDPRSDTLRTNWSISPQRTIGGVSAQAGLEKHTYSRAVDGRLQYVGDRSVFSLSHRNEWNDVLDPNAATTSLLNTKTELRQLTSAQLSFGLVYAGGHFGLSRPIVDSFLMINQINTAKNEILDINPQSDGSSSASSSAWGPAILPELPSYHRSSILLGTKKFKAGASISQDHFELFPTYKSGYSIEVGNEASKSLSVTLLSDEGKPLGLQAGSIVSISNPQMTPIIAFTGRLGQMYVEGLKVGKYELRLYDLKWDSLMFEITEETPATYDLGTLQLKRRQQ